jgi:hypothetical protein
LIHNGKNITCDWSLSIIHGNLFLSPSFFCHTAWV